MTYGLITHKRSGVSGWHSTKLVKDRTETIEIWRYVVFKLYFFRSTLRWNSLNFLSSDIICLHKKQILSYYMSVKCCVQETLKVEVRRLVEADLQNDSSSKAYSLQTWFTSFAKSGNRWGEHNRQYVVKIVNETHIFTVLWMKKAFAVLSMKRLRPWTVPGVRPGYSVTCPTLSIAQITSWYLANLINMVYKEIV